MRRKMMIYLLGSTTSRSSIPTDAPCGPESILLAGRRSRYMRTGRLLHGRVSLLAALTRLPLHTSSRYCAPNLSLLQLAPLLTPDPNQAVHRWRRETPRLTAAAPPWLLVSTLARAQLDSLASPAANLFRGRCASATFRCDKHLASRGGGREQKGGEGAGPGWKLRASIGWPRCPPPFPPPSEPTESLARVASGHPWTGPLTYRTQIRSLKHALVPLS